MHGGFEDSRSLLGNLEEIFTFRGGLKYSSFRSNFTDVFILLGSLEVTFALRSGLENIFPLRGRLLDIMELTVTCKQRRVRKTFLFLWASGRLPPRGNLIGGHRIP